MGRPRPPQVSAAGGKCSPVIPFSVQETLHEDTAGASIITNVMVPYSKTAMVPYTSDIPQ